MSDLNSLFYFIIFISISTLFLFSLGSKDYFFNFIASFPIVISIIVLPVFLDWNHNIEPIFSNLIVVILIIFAIFNLLSNGIESSLGKHSIKILVLSILSILFSYLLLLFSSEYIQYTPDTYIYEFIARAIRDKAGIYFLEPGWLLLRGLVLPSLMAFFYPNFQPISLPSIIYIFIFISFFYFSTKHLAKYNRSKHVIFKNYILSLLLFSVFLFSVQGAFLSIYPTTHGFIAICVIIFVGIIYLISEKKINFEPYHFFILFSCMFVVCLARPEGTFLSIFGLILIIGKIDLPLKYIILFFNSLLSICLYWYFNLYSIFNGSETLLLTLVCVIMFVIGNLVILKARSSLHIFINQNMLRLVLFFVAITLSYSYSLVLSSLPKCFDSIFLNGGGLGVIPYIYMIVLCFNIYTLFRESNIFINVSLLGLLVSYSIYPVLNQNSWFCDSAGWGGSLNRSWIHFVPLLFIGVFILISKRVIRFSLEH